MNHLECVAEDGEDVGVVVVPMKTMTVMKRGVAVAIAGEMGTLPLFASRQLA